MTEEKEKEEGRYQMKEEVNREVGLYRMKEEVIDYFKQWFSEEQLNEIMRIIPTAPSHTTVRFIPTNETPLPTELIDYLEKNPPRENGDKWSYFTLPSIPDILFIIDDKFNAKEIECQYPLVAVDQNCASSLLRGAHLMAVGVLGVQRATKHNNNNNSDKNIINDNNDDDDDDIDNEKGGENNKEIKGFCKGGKVSVVLDVDKVLKRGFDLSSPQCLLPSTAPFIGNGIVLMNRKEIFGAKSGGGIAVNMIETIHSSPSLHSFVENSSSLFLQNFSSALVAHILQRKPKEGERIYDMCAAPGGKTTHLAQLTGDKCQIYAGERSKGKLPSFHQLLSRLNIKSVIPIHIDSTKSLISTPKKKGMFQGFEKESFDKILLDPPCSGVGLRPRFADDYTTVEILKQHSLYQRKLFSVGYELLKRGGEMVYSTCTINPEENEEVVAWALNTYSDLVLLPQPEKYFFGTAGLSSSSLGDRSHLVQRFTPSIPTSSNPFSHSAFFIAHFHKRNP